MRFPSRVGVLACIDSDLSILMPPMPVRFLFAHGLPSPSRPVSCLVSVRFDPSSPASMVMGCGCPVVLVEDVRVVAEQVVAVFYLFYYRVISCVAPCSYGLYPVISVFSHSCPVPGNWRSETGSVVPSIAVVVGPASVGCRTCVLVRFHLA